MAQPSKFQNQEEEPEGNFPSRSKKDNWVINLWHWNRSRLWGTEDETPALSGTGQRNMERVYVSPWKHGTDCQLAELWELFSLAGRDSLNFLNCLDLLPWAVYMNSERYVQLKEPQQLWNVPPRWGFILWMATKSTGHKIASNLYLFSTVRSKKINIPF